MVTIGWNPTAFHIIRVRPSGCRFNSSYYQIHILGPLSKWRSEQAAVAGETWIVDASLGVMQYTAGVSERYGSRGNTETPAMRCNQC
jgi:hypothetical protein